MGVEEGQYFTGVEASVSFIKIHKEVLKHARNPSEDHGDQRGLKHAPYQGNNAMTTTSEVRALLLCSRVAGMLQLWPPEVCEAVDMQNSQ